MATNDSHVTLSPNVSSIRAKAIEEIKRRRGNFAWMKKLRAKLKRLKKEDPNVYPLY
jgi:transcriptional regulator